ncbi:fungal-specific transcription factor domain-containing protein [Hypoxylon trugodes]|uniref:fungal-specific transcription factor domain-containing protein n=1 Tax=Hypoxylon trugodes TaxID=326681 RepID=UPI00219AA7C4|nr:fungal-specific transcription factor domain-containing protein [Hypoxylon trugodes]KAI1387141.1 fungal-specific transcription factor domain-containing protein [Hypoxylon trugodes]
MAAAPARRVSCLHCRRRRVKCDREIPACGACQRLRLECHYKQTGSDLLWMPINSGNAEFEPIGKLSSDQDEISLHDHLISEKAPHPRRIPVSTEEERRAMCQQLLESTKDMDIDDAMQLLSTSAEGGTEAILMGPFGAFPMQAAGKMGVSSLQVPNPSDTIPSPDLPRHGANYTSSFTGLFVGSPSAAYLESLIQGDDDSASVDILASVLDQDWEKLLPGANFDALTCGPIAAPSSRSPANAEALRPKSHPPPVPSPLSDYLPFLRPSQILERVPKDTFYLLEYYGSKVLFFFSPLPDQKPPWKIMHHPSVLEITGALLVDQPVKHAQLALLYAILAISSYHLDWCTTFNQRMQGGGGLDRTNKAESYWRNSGEQFKRNAKAQLQLALKSEFFGTSKAKYKHILMTLLCMVTICVQTGSMEEARCFLLDAERAIHLRGLKPNRSRKVRLLHNIFLYNRIIEESTFIYPHADPSATNSGRRVDIRGIMPPISSEGGGGALDPSNSENEKSLVDQLISSDGVWFETIYGVPMSLMSLMSQATSLAREADSEQLAFQSAKLHTLASFASRVRALEDQICAFHWEPGQGTQDIPPGPATIYRDVMRPLVSAMHQALLIFFYRRIRKMNSYALQPFVKRTISELIEFQRAKAQNSIVTPVPCWPGFVAGSEALEEEDRQRVRQWFSHAGRGWRSFDTVGKLLEKFWVSRELAVSANFGAGEVTWEHFFKDQGVAIITT